jgi:hypothetical protein
MKYYCSLEQNRVCGQYLIKLTIIFGPKPLLYRYIAEVTRVKHCIYIYIYLKHKEKYVKETW